MWFIKYSILNGTVYSFDQSIAASVNRRHRGILLTWRHPVAGLLQSAAAYGVAAARTNALLLSTGGGSCPAALHWRMQ